jgi:hydroxyacylglutathione hydrolase
MFGFELEEKPVPLGKYIHQGDTIAFGNTKLEVFEVPGHSPGSVVFFNRESGDLIVGDVLFNGSVGRADLQGGNFNDLKQNIIEKLFILPNETVVHPGHGPSTTIGHEKMYNPFFTDISTH